MNYPFKKLSGILVTIFITFVLTAVAYAAEEQEKVSLGLPQQIGNFYAWALGIGGLVALGVLVFGGILYTTSAGNASRQDDAKQWITGSIVGLIILFGSFFILNTINPELTKLTDLKLLANKGTGENTSVSSTCIPGVTATGAGTVGGATTIVLDPGHAGAPTVQVDPATGLDTKENGGSGAGPPGGEIQNMWDTAQIIKSKLESAGYRVVLTKSSARDTAGFVDKVRIANNSGAALAVSLHYDGTGTFGALTGGHWGVTPQQVGQYREDKDGDRVAFQDAALAQKSQQYAQIIAEERNKVGDKTKVTPLDQSFSEERFKSGDISAFGNIPIVMLLGKAPWVYNETGGINFDKEKYAEGITNGIMRAVPLGTAGITSSSGNCTNYEAFAAVARSYATPSPVYAGSAPSDPRLQAYINSPPPTKDSGAGDCYGADCGSFVGTVVTQTIDPNWPARGTPNIADYLKTDEAKRKFDVIQNNPLDTSKLQSGDILLSSNPYDVSGHVSIWLDDGEYEASWSTAGCVSAQLPHGPESQPSNKMTQIIRYKHW